jgi:predicted methyltransferase
MKSINGLILMVLLSTVVGGNLSAADQALSRAIASESRSEAFVMRDAARHPQEVLEFFGIKPDMSVAEIWPSGGWWTEILAPYLKDKGKYYAVGFSLTAKRTPQWRKNRPPTVRPGHRHFTFGP